MRAPLLALAGGLLFCCAPAGAQQPAPPIETGSATPAGIRVQQDTPIRLMVLNEVSTRTAKPGDRFVLRVDEPVTVGGVTVIPVGAKAWGQITDAQASGSVGKSGRIGAKLLHVELGDQQVPISGERKTEGEKNGTQLTLGLLALGPLALFSRGNNARLKAGEIFSAYLDAEMVFDPATSRLVPASQ
ncbi:MAG TPA: hypothetical protein VEY69_08760 [Lautropia sp.]|jgi:hypothetical protein|nr:hypothetical protein [Lautropia sp.]